MKTERIFGSMPAEVGGDVHAGLPAGAGIAAIRPVLRMLAGSPCG